MHKEMTFADLMLFICLLKKLYTQFAITFQTSYRAITYHITSYHIISYPIISNHIISHQIKSNQIISYQHHIVLSDIIMP